MFDAEEEDRQDEAVRIMQRKARIFIAKMRLKKMTRTNYIKKYDRINDYYYYKNKTTGQIMENKPVCLGMDDLDEPRSFDAPDGYDAGDDETWKGLKGFVHEAAKAHFDGRFANHKAYLCGPPPMIDAAITALMQGRLFEKDIFMEKFLTAADGADEHRSALFKKI